MLTKLHTEYPKIVFKGTSDDFYLGNHYVEIENSTIEFRYSQFHKNQLQNLGAELSYIIENDISIKIENVFNSVVGYFNEDIFYLKTDIGESEYLILIACSESQPNIYWIGIESVWKYDSKA